MVSNLKVPCSIDNLKSIRSFVTEKLQELSIPELEINMMVLAVDEICANLIIHSNNSNQDQTLELTIKDESHGVTFEIMDKGVPFDVSAYETPEIDDLVKSKRKGGLGLMLVKRIMDQIEFRQEADFNVLRMFKKVSFSS